MAMSTVMVHPSLTSRCIVTMLFTFCYTPTWTFHINLCVTIFVTFVACVCFITIDNCPCTLTWIMEFFKLKLNLCPSIISQILCPQFHFYSSIIVSLPCVSTYYYFLIAKYPEYIFWVSCRYCLSRHFHKLKSLRTFGFPLGIIKQRISSDF